MNLNTYNTNIENDDVEHFKIDLKKKDPLTRAIKIIIIVVVIAIIIFICFIMLGLPPPLTQTVSNKVSNNSSSKS